MTVRNPVASAANVCRSNLVRQQRCSAVLWPGRFLSGRAFLFGLSPSEGDLYNAETMKKIAVSMAGPLILFCSTRAQQPTESDFEFAIADFEMD